MIAEGKILQYIGTYVHIYRECPRIAADERLYDQITLKRKKNIKHY